MSVFNNLSVRNKLNTLAALGLIGVGVVAFVGRMSVGILADTSDKLLLNSEHVITHQQADMMHDALRGDVFAAILSVDEAQRAGVRADALAHAKIFKDAVDSNLATAGDSAPAQAIRDIAPALTTYLAESQRLVELGTHDPAAARAALPAFEVVFGELEEGMAKITELFDAEAKSQASDGVTNANQWLLISTGIAAATQLLLSYVIGRSISARLGRVVEVLNGVADRDFTQRLEVDSTDELGQLSDALNRAVGGVSEALSEVQALSVGLSDSAQELTASAQTIAAGASEQAASLEQTAASLEQITSTVRQSSDNANQASQLAAGSRESAERGGSVVERAIGAMGEINEASTRIAEIIATIDEIAFQTNILALNAAVEAARAGEQGRGFAVVAEQVGHLAQRSAGAAKEIKGLIQDSVRKVNGGTELVNRSGSSLQEIVTSVRRVTDIVGEMAAAFREQSAGLGQVNTAITQMGSVTQSNSAQTEQLSSTASGLSEHADRMREVVGAFRLPTTASTVRAVGPVAARAQARATRPAPAASAPGAGRARTAPAPTRTAPARNGAAPDVLVDGVSPDAMDAAMSAPKSGSGSAPAFEEM